MHVVECLHGFRIVLHVFESSCDVGCPEADYVCCSHNSCVYQGTVHGDCVENKALKKIHEWNAVIYWDWFVASLVVLCFFVVCCFQLFSKIDRSKNLGLWLQCLLLFQFEHQTYKCDSNNNNAGCDCSISVWNPLLISLPLRQKHKMKIFLVDRNRRNVPTNAT